MASGGEATPAERPIPQELRPDATRKFEGKGVEGDINQVVGGASADAPAKAKDKDQPAPADHTSSLLAAKRRARDQMDKKDQT